MKSDGKTISLTVPNKLQSSLTWYWLVGIWCWSLHVFRFSLVSIWTSNVYTKCRRGVFMCVFQTYECDIPLLNCVPKDIYPITYITLSLSKLYYRCSCFLLILIVVQFRFFLFVWFLQIKTAASTTKTYLYIYIYFNVSCILFTRLLYYAMTWLKPSPNIGQIKHLLYFKYIFLFLNL